MRVVDRTAFLELPKGTFYCKGKEWLFGPMCIKHESIPGDWYYVNPAWVDGDDTGECVTRLKHSRENGSSHPMADLDIPTRDGCFEKDAIFLVFEKEDLAKLRAVIDEATK